jgi:hypothetical protein
MCYFPRLHNFEDVIFPSWLDNRVWNWSGKKKLAGTSKQKEINLPLCLLFIYGRQSHPSPIVFTYIYSFSVIELTAYTPRSSPIFCHTLHTSPRYICITNYHQNLVAMPLYKRGLTALKRWSITSNYTMFRASGPFIVVLSPPPPPHILMGHSGKVCPASLGDSFIERWRSINI